MSLYLGTSPVAAPHQSLSNIVDAFYPVGSIFIGTTSTCPLAAIKGTWTLQSTGIVTSVNTNVPIKGNGITIGLTDGTSNAGLGSFVQGSCAYEGLYGLSVGTVNQTSAIGNGKGNGLTTDASKSGIVGTVTRSVLSVNIWKRTA